MWLSIKLEPESDKMKIIATKDRDSDSLFYLIPTGMREVCIQLVMNDHKQFRYCSVDDFIGLLLNILDNLYGYKKTSVKGDNQITDITI